MVIVMPAVRPAAVSQTKDSPLRQRASVANVEVVADMDKKGLDQLVAVAQAVTENFRYRIEGESEQE